MRISYRLESELWELVRVAPDVEVCGLIDLDAQEVFPIPNLDPNPAHYYTAAPPELIAAVTELRRRGADFAVYHSHPETHATPSEGDKESSGNYRKQVILAPRFAEMRAYEVEGGVWTEVAVSQQKSEEV